MSLEELWRDLERHLPQGRPGRRQQRLHPDAAADLMLAVVAPGAHRSLTLTVPTAIAAGESGEPWNARGVELHLHEGPAESTLELLLVDDALRDVFTALCADVAAATAAASEPSAAVRAWHGRLARWQRLLQRAPRGLSPERQRGLFGELWLLTEQLAAAFGVEAAVGAWTGPDRTVHDFQGPLGAIEVKTSIANEPQVVRINGERQLDDSAVPALHLLHLSLELRRDAGTPLPEAVEHARQAAAGSPVAGVLEDRLLAYGYLDAHEPLYRRTGYTLRDVHAFRVTQGFPRIIETELVDGLGRVHYNLAIAACGPWGVPLADCVAAVTS